MRYFGVALATEILTYVRYAPLFVTAAIFKIALVIQFLGNIKRVSRKGHPFFVVISGL